MTPDAAQLYGRATADWWHYCPECGVMVHGDEVHDVCEGDEKEEAEEDESGV